MRRLGAPRRGCCRTARSESLDLAIEIDIDWGTQFMGQGNRNTMDPAEREAMDELEWSRGFDDGERPESSEAEGSEVLSGPFPGDSEKGADHGRVQDRP